MCSRVYKACEIAEEAQTWLGVHHKACQIAEGKDDENYDDGVKGEQKGVIDQIDTLGPRGVGSCM